MLVMEKKSSKAHYGSLHLTVEVVKVDPMSLPKKGGFLLTIGLINCVPAMAGHLQQVYTIDFLRTGNQLLWMRKWSLKIYYGLFKVSGHRCLLRWFPRFLSSRARKECSCSFGPPKPTSKDDWINFYGCFFVSKLSNIFKLTNVTSHYCRKQTAPRLLELLGHTS